MSLKPTTLNSGGTTDINLTVSAAANNKIYYRIEITDQNKQLIKSYSGEAINNTVFITAGPFFTGGAYIIKTLLSTIDNDQGFASSGSKCTTGFKVTGVPTPTIMISTPTPTATASPSDTQCPFAGRGNCMTTGCGQPDYKSCRNYTCGNGKTIHNVCILTVPVNPLTPTDTPLSVAPVCDKNGDYFECPSALGPINTNPTLLIKSLFGIILSLSGGIALLLIIYSGFSMMVSQGDPEKVKGAKETMTSAVVGLLFIIFSLVILQLIGFTVLRIPGFN